MRILPLFFYYIYVSTFYISIFDPTWYHWIPRYYSTQVPWCPKHYVLSATSDLRRCRFYVSNAWIYLALSRDSSVSLSGTYKLVRTFWMTACLECTHTWLLFFFKAFLTVLPLHFFIWTPKSPWLSQGKKKKKQPSGLCSIYNLGKIIILMLMLRFHFSLLLCFNANRKNLVKVMRTDS